jgi:hypothetical protein
MNYYRHKFIAPCPNDARNVEYELEIETLRTIMTEDIEAGCAEAAKCEKPYHETMADILIAKFGGRQTITATHGKTEITTIRQ